MEWTDPRKDVPLDEVLGMVSLYWFTETFSGSLYHATIMKRLMEGIPHPTSMEKPLGYSMFPHDLAVLPQPWAEKLYPNLVFFNRHTEVSELLSP